MKGDGTLLEWKANCRRTKGPRGWPHPSRHQHGKALKLGRLLTRVVHVPPPCERVKYGVTRFPSKPVIRLEGVVPSLFPLSFCLGRCAEAKRPPYLSLRLLIGKHDFKGLVTYVKRKSSDETFTILFVITEKLLRLLYTYWLYFGEIFTLPKQFFWMLLML